MSATRYGLAQALSGIVPILIILLIAVYRLVPHPWNVAPVGALFVLSGAYLGNTWRGWLFPFAAVFISTSLIYFRWDGTLFRIESLGDYFAYALILLLGIWARTRGVALRVGGVLVTPMVFFLVSNFGVWVGPNRLYPHTVIGLVDCYVAAIPFFRGTLAGDWFFGISGILAIEGFPRLTSRLLHAV